MSYPHRQKLWNVEILADGKNDGRIQVAVDEGLYSDTVEMRVASYYQSITKDHIKVTAKARPSQNKKPLLQF